MANATRRRWLWALLIILPVISVLLAVATLTLRNQPATTAPAVTVTRVHGLTGTAAPNFELAQLDADRSVRLSSLRGQLVFINFWAIWCEPCRREFPAFQNYLTADDHTGTLLAVNVGDQPDKITPYLAELGIDAVPVLLDSEFAVSDAYNTDLFPSTFVVDAAGVVRTVHIGEITEADLERYAAEYAS